MKSAGARFQRLDSFEYNIVRSSLHTGSSIWRLDHSDPAERFLKRWVGDGYDDLNSRDHAGRITGGYKGQGPKFSVFSPTLTANILQRFILPGSKILDPFAGGGTRALISSMLGYGYHGVDIRAEEVENVRSRLSRRGLLPGVSVEQGDSRHLPHLGANSFDAVLTCPPYHVLEKYDGGPGDLSEIADYERFLQSLGACIGESFRLLKPGGMAAWVVGIFRDDREKKHPRPLVHFPSDVRALHDKYGFNRGPEIIIQLAGTGQMKRIGSFEKGGRYMIRSHEYLLLFHKESAGVSEAVKGTEYNTLAPGIVEQLQKFYPEHGAELIWDPLKKSTIVDQKQIGSHYDAPKPTDGSVTKTVAEYVSPSGQPYGEDEMREAMGLSFDALSADGLSCWLIPGWCPIGRDTTIKNARDVGFIHKEEIIVSPGPKNGEWHHSVIGEPIDVTHYYLEVFVRPKHKTTTASLQSDLMPVTSSGPKEPVTKVEFLIDAHSQDLFQVTPVQSVGNLFLKREDTFLKAGVYGAKVRVADAIIRAEMAKRPLQGLVTAGSAQSPQTSIIACLARHHGLECKVWIPNRTVTALPAEPLIAVEAGAEVQQNRSAIFPKQCEAAAKAYSENEDGWLLIPFGMDSEIGVRLVANQVENIPDGVQRIVVAVGSGLTLAGVLTGLRARGMNIPILGVTVGRDPNPLLDRYLKWNWRDQCELVPSKAGYKTEVFYEPILPGLYFDPVYEAKAVPFLKAGDLFWLTGIRPSAMLGPDPGKKVRPLPRVE